MGFGSSWRGHEAEGSEGGGGILVWARDFESRELNALRIPEAVKGFGRIVAANVEVCGVCDRCAREHAEESGSHNPKAPRGKDRSRT